MRILSVSELPVRCLAYSPDGRLLAAGDEGGGVRLWTLPDTTLEGSLRLDEHSVEALAFHPAGDLLATGNAAGELALWRGGGLWKAAVWDLVISSGGHPGGVRALLWTSDGNTLVSSCWDSAVQFLTAGLSARRVPLATAAPVTALAVGPAPQSVLLADYQGQLHYLGPTARILASARADNGLFSLAATASLAATGDAAGHIDLWRLPDLHRLATLPAHEWTVYGLAFTPSGRSLISGSADGTVRVWDVASRTLLETFRWHGRWVTGVAVAPDGMTAAAASADGTVVVWDLADL